jgi:hypothetical protein
MCGKQTSSFVRSHIVPRALVLDGMDPGGTVVLAGTDSRPTRSPIGVYSRIVCDGCERSFHTGDDYLIETIRGLGASKIAFDGEMSVLEGVDAGLLQRGILGVLYRAHLSDHEVFKAVDLGRESAPLAEFLLSARMSPPHQFSMFLRHLVGPLAPTTFCPFRESWSGVNAYRLYFPYLTAMIKVDGMRLPRPLRDFELRYGTTPVAMRNENFSPSEFRVVNRIVERSGADISRIFEKMKLGRFKSAPNE